MEEQHMDQGGHERGHDAGGENAHADGEIMLLPGPEAQGQPHGDGASDEKGHRDRQEVFPGKIPQGGDEPGPLPAQVQQRIVGSHAQDHAEGHHTGKDHSFLSSFRHCFISPLS